MFSTAISGHPPPERSPLEPALSYDLRVKKWRRDNAKWEGQKKAVKTLDEKKTTVPPAIDPRAFP